MYQFIYYSKKFEFTSLGFVELTEFCGTKRKKENILGAIVLKKIVLVKKFFSLARLSNPGHYSASGYESSSANVKKY